jgi:hypothetical protein
VVPTDCISSVDRRFCDSGDKFIQCPAPLLRSRDTDPTRRGVEPASLEAAVGRVRAADATSYIVDDLVGPDWINVGEAALAGISHTGLVSERR